MISFEPLYAILPAGTVVNETIFFSYISILIGLLTIAFWLRRKRTKNNFNGTEK
jgi:hypothetical protein